MNKRQNQQPKEVHTHLQEPEQLSLPFPEPETKAGETVCGHLNNPIDCKYCREARNYLYGRCNDCGFSLDDNQLHVVGPDSLLCSHVRGI